MATDSSAATVDQVRLPQTAQAISTRIDDPLLRERVETTVCLCLAVLSDLGRVHLPHDDFEEGGGARPVHGRYQELAPYVLAAVAGINRLLAYMIDAFPPPARSDGDDRSDDDFDLAFDLVDGPTGEGSRLSGKEQSQVLPPKEQVADAAHAFGSMLRGRVLAFGDRLRHALAKNDSWPLLAEVDDNKHRLVKAVQGVLFGVLGVFAPDTKRESILPEYRSAVGEGVRLRAALADLSYRVGRFNGAVGKASGPEELVPLVVGLADQLRRFSGKPEYRTLRAEDKKAVVDFRRTLYDLRHNQKGIPTVPLRHAVEGFSKFLESMQAINHREVLVLHDRQRLADGLGLLDEAAQATDADEARDKLLAVVETMRSLLGRDGQLDEVHRHFAAEQLSEESVPVEVLRWRTVLEAALSRVG